MGLSSEEVTSLNDVWSANCNNPHYQQIVLKVFLCEPLSCEFIRFPVVYTELTSHTPREQYLLLSMNFKASAKALCGACKSFEVLVLLCFVTFISPNLASFSVCDFSTSCNPSSLAGLREQCFIENHCSLIKTLKRTVESQKIGTCLVGEPPFLIPSTIKQEQTS